MSPTILGIALTIILIKFNLANSQNANQKPFDENQLFSDVVYMNTQNFINSKKKKKTQGVKSGDRGGQFYVAALLHIYQKPQATFPLLVETYWSELHSASTGNVENHYF